MGKSARKKKEKKADFQKVKFKVGKKIKKGNVVDTTFKTKKIVLREQLKEDSVEGGKGRRDIKETLSRIQHHNSSMRCDALNALKECLVSCPDQIDAHLGTIVARSMEACVDRDEFVRRATYNLLKHLFSAVSASNMLPFFPTIVAHLRCATTHIVHDVQYSSLLVIDLLVDSYPNHLTHFSKQLLPDFLSQISDEKMSEVVKTMGLDPEGGDESSKKKKKKTTTTLSSDPSRAVTSVAWHLQVAKRLRKILYHIWARVSDEKGAGEVGGNVVLWQKDRPLHVSLHSVQSVASDSNRTQLVDFFDSPDQLKNLFGSLAPLLIEMWVEGSSLDLRIGKNAVTNRSLEIYCCIVDIIRLMWKLVQLWREDEKELQAGFFDERFVQNFIAHCMAGFPYADYVAHIGTRRGRKGKSTSSGGRTVFSLNLLLCDIATCFGASVQNARYSAELAWLLSVVHQWDEWSSDEAETLVVVVRRFLSCKSGSTARKVLVAICSLFGQLSLEHGTRNLLLSLFHDVLVLPTFAHVRSEHCLWMWICSMPEELTKYEANVPSLMLKIIQRVACHGRKDFFFHVKKHLSELLELSALHLNGDDFKVVANLLYWIPHLDEDFYTTLSSVCLHPSLTSTKCAYIVHLMNSRFQRQIGLNGNKNSAIYLSFLFSVIFGCSASEMQNLEKGSLPARSQQKVFVSRFQGEFELTLDECEVLEHQREVTNVAIDVLNLVPLEFELQTLVEAFLSGIMVEYRILPLRCVQSILLLVASVWKNAELCTSLHAPLCKLFLTVIEICTGKYRDLYRNVLGAARKVLVVPSFSSTVSSVLLDLTTESSNDDRTCAVIGEMLSEMTKCKENLDAKAIENLRSIFKELERSNSVAVSASHWYLSSRYELGLYSQLES